MVMGGVICHTIRYIRRCLPALFVVLLHVRCFPVGAFATIRAFLSWSLGLTSERWFLLAPSARVLLRPFVLRDVCRVLLCPFRKYSITSRFGVFRASFGLCVLLIMHFDRVFLRVRACLVVSMFPSMGVLVPVCWLVLLFVAPRFSFCPFFRVLLERMFSFALVPLGLLGMVGASLSGFRGGLFFLILLSRVSLVSGLVLIVLLCLLFLLATFRVSILRSYALFMWAFLTLTVSTVR